MIEIKLKGMDAAQHDDETGELTDCPYRADTEPLHQRAWYDGYNYYMEHKDKPTTQ